MGKKARASRANRARRLSAPDSVKLSSGYGGSVSGLTPSSTAAQWPGQNPSGKPFPVMEKVPDNKPLLKNLGATGVAIFSGVVTSEEYNPDFYWRDGIAIYEQMLRSEAQIAAIRNAIELPIRRATWSIQPASDEPVDIEIASFVESCLFHDMQYTTTEGHVLRQKWDDILRHMLMHLWYGFMAFEQVWRVEDGWVKWARWTPLLPRTVYRWWVGEDNELVGIQQWTFKNYSYQFVDIPVEKLLLFVNRQEGNNYEGVSLLRQPYKNWFYVQQFEKIEAIAEERNAVSIPVIYLPDGYTGEMASLAQSIVQNMRVNEMAGVVLPHSMPAEYMKNQQKYAAQVQPSIQYHQAQIARAILADFLQSTTTGTGSYAQTSSRIDFFLLALQTVCEYVEDVVNNDAIRRLVDYNYAGVAVYPKLKASKLTSTNVQEVAAALAELGAGQFVTPSPETEDWLREILGAPATPSSAVQTTNPTSPSNDDRPDGAAADDHGDQENENDNGSETSFDGEPAGTGPSLTEMRATALAVGLAEEASLLRLALDEARGLDAVERGVAHDAVALHNPYPRGPHGRFGEGGMHGQGEHEDASGGVHGSGAKASAESRGSGGGGGGGGGSSRGRAQPANGHESHEGLPSKSIAMARELRAGGQSGGAKGKAGVKAAKSEAEPTAPKGKSGSAKGKGSAKVSRAATTRAAANPNASPEARAHAAKSARYETRIATLSQQLEGLRAEYEAHKAGQPAPEREMAARGKSAKAEAEPVRLERNEPTASRLAPRSVDITQAQDAHFLRALYGDHQLAAVVSRYQGDRLRAMAAFHGVKPGRSAAVTRQRIIEHVQRVPMDESIRIANANTSKIGYSERKGILEHSTDLASLSERIAAVEAELSATLAEYEAYRLSNGEDVESIALGYDEGSHPRGFHGRWIATGGHAESEGEGGGGGGGGIHGSGAKAAAHFHNGGGGGGGGSTGARGAGEHAAAGGTRGGSRRGVGAVKGEGEHAGPSRAAMAKGHAEAESMHAEAVAARGGAKAKGATLETLQPVGKVHTESLRPVGLPNPHALLEGYGESQMRGVLATHTPSELRTMAGKLAQQHGEALPAMRTKGELIDHIVSHSRVDAGMRRGYDAMKGATATTAAKGKAGARSATAKASQSPEERQAAQAAKKAEQNQAKHEELKAKAEQARAEAERTATESARAMQAYIDSGGTAGGHYEAIVAARQADMARSKAERDLANFERRQARAAESKPEGEAKPKKPAKSTRAPREPKAAEPELRPLPGRTIDIDHFDPYAMPNPHQLMHIYGEGQIHAALGGYRMPVLRAMASVMERQTGEPAPRVNSKAKVVEYLATHAQDGEEAASAFSGLSRGIRVSK